MPKRIQIAQQVRHIRVMRTSIHILNIITNRDHSTDACMNSIKSLKFQFRVVVFV